ncbi:histidine phosphatase family protein [Deinococcus aquiradiocola]|uniref:Phosphoglycerate mutase n=1 Tax=Deinococcus aquiradiocola TaxID=393059 RepID=A0A917UJ40_9DEIO|nr:histidine phosphatase family protein [Deinococcus aquiradiocola]GGJ61627.1 phosphoglycerate mutase [Deinococcus aquiradiocola]
MSRLILVRHGQTPANAARAFRGPNGDTEPLDERGHAQAQALARHLGPHLAPLAAQGRVRVYASPFTRAQQTAGPLASAIGQPLGTLPGVHEVHTGHWQGQPYSRMDTHAHELVAGDGHFGFPGGESLHAVAQRMTAALDGVRPRAGETLVVVSHGAAITAYLAALHGTDPGTAWRRDTYRHLNTAYSELDWPQDGPATLARLAVLDHLGAPA